MQNEVPFPEVEDLLTRYDIEPVHVFHVGELTLQIFDQLKDWHGLDPRDRSLLHAAALLHDIGWSQTPDGKGHHKESMRLIDAKPWDTINPFEKDLVAQCARYHRKSIPHAGHHRFQSLKKSDQERLQKMASFLRIADALDRTHRQIVKMIKIEQSKKCFTFHLHSEIDPQAEIKMAQAKGNLLELISEKEIFYY